MQKIEKIFSYLGGSHAYGLNNAESDRDERGIFTNTERSKIYGLETHEHQEERVTDTFYFELRKFLRLLQKGNTQALEALFTKENILLETKQSEFIRENKKDLLDSETVYKTLRGYAQGEKHIITGQTHGKLGEKRKQAIEKYGYSYRNAVHAIRLLRCGIIFFETDEYPVNIVKDDKEFGVLTKNIKNNPQDHNVNTLLSLIAELEVKLTKTFNDRSVNHTFNMDYAVEICHFCYRDYLS